MRRCLLFLLCVWVWGVCPATAGAQSPSKIEIAYQDGELSADIEDASLEDVLEVITERTGLDIWVDDDVPHTVVSVAFKGWELDKGLKKILGGTNYAFVYGPDRSIVTVSIFGKVNQDFPDIPIEAPPSNDQVEPPPEPKDDGDTAPPPPPEDSVENPPPDDPPVVTQDADGNAGDGSDSGG